jgi:hypothetical protein
MGITHSSSFELLGIAHIKGFILYGRCKKTNDVAGMEAVVQFLLENVDACKSEIKSRIPIPGIGLLIGSRFQESMRAEILLFHDPVNALLELKSCHESIVKALALAFAKKETWEKLWQTQLMAMLEFVNEDTSATEEMCLSAAQSLGQAFDALARTRISSAGM